MLAFLAALACLTPLAVQDTFVEARNMLPSSVPSYPVDVEGADIDLDGDLDVLVATSQGLDVCLRNAGAGLFEPDPAALPAVEANTSAVAVGDLDGDGDPDAVFLRLPTPSKIYRNDAGVFTAVGDLGVAMKYASYGDLGDMDLDGDLDLLVVGAFGQGNRLYENTGAFALVLAPSSFLPVVQANATGVDLVDLNGDGDLDAYVTSRSTGGYVTDFVMLGRNNLKFANAALFVPSDSFDAALADLDGDGDVDAYLADGYHDSIAWNDGTAGLTLAAAPGGLATLRARADDLDGDSVIDLLVSGGAGTTKLAGTGGGAFVDTTASSLPAKAVLNTFVTGDLDGDLDVDLLGLPYGAPAARLWFNDGGVFGEAQGWVSGMASYHGAVDLVSGDVNGDGYEDVLTVISVLKLPQSADLWLGGPDGDLVLAPAQFATTEKDQSQGALLDADGDGDLDALITRASDPASMYLNDGAGTFTELAGAQPAQLQRVQDLEVGDLDGDGDLDVVSASGIWDPSAAFWGNDGAGHLSLAFSFGGPAVAIVNAAELLDVDADGDLDVALGGDGSRIFTNDGVGGFAEKAGALPSLVVANLDSGDVDGDGDLDLMLVGYYESSLVLNDGTGAFSPSAGWADPAIEQIFAQLEDVDGDLDLVTVAAKTLFGQPDTNTVFRNDGTGTFDAGTEFGDAPLGFFRLIDVDHDGDRDVVTSALTVHVNTAGGQVVRRTLARIGKSLRMEVYGEPGAPWALALATAKAEIPLAGFGTLLLDPAKLFVTGSGLMPADGLAQQVYALAQDPALVGVTVYWQALSGAAPTLSNRDATTVTSF